MFNMEFDDETLTHDFHLPSGVLFSELVDIGGDGAEQLFNDEGFAAAAPADQSVDRTTFDDDDVKVQERPLQSVSNSSSNSRPSNARRWKTKTQQPSRGDGSTSVDAKRRPPRPTSRNAARERSRVKSLRSAFLQLQNSLPSVPPNTKLSKLDVLVLATTYIAHLMKTLDETASSPPPLPPPPTMTTGHDDAAVADVIARQSIIASDNVVDGTTAEVRHHRLHEKGYLHPVRKWPMRSRLYAGAFDLEMSQLVFRSTGAAIVPNVSTSTPSATASPTTVFGLRAVQTNPSCNFDELFAVSTDMNTCMPIEPLTITCESLNLRHQQ